MVLKNVEGDPAYGRLLRDLLDQWYRQIDDKQGRGLGRDTHREHGFIFVSSPNSVTPYHLDDEHNCLLQVRGTKQVSIWDPNDRTVITEALMESHLECFHDANHERYLPWQDEFQKRAQVFELTPGEGLHFPFGAPHWVKNGPAASVSFSITFRSEFSERLAVVYSVNKRLRRFGLNPTPPTRSASRDKVKIAAFETARRASRLVRSVRRSEG
jgi:hypothetical protein